MDSTTYASKDCSMIFAVLTRNEKQMEIESS